MRIGILGGSFDPIHYGHLRAAEHACHGQQLDQVLFIPARRSPLKADTQASAAHRVAMVRLAVEGYPAFAVSMVDVERPPPSYATDTVAALQNAAPAASFVFLIGTDQLTDLPHWRSPEQLALMVPIVALTRPGSMCTTAQAIAQLSPAARDRITVQEIPAVDISASAIRGHVAGGTSIRGLTPDPVLEYIEEYNLYR
jgi:nicotinate-nucleotide adenylyltransferase